MAMVGSPGSGTVLWWPEVGISFSIIFFSLFLCPIHHYMLCRIRFFYQIRTLSVCQRQLLSLCNPCCLLRCSELPHSSLYYHQTIFKASNVFCYISFSLVPRSWTSLAFSITWTTMPARDLTKCFCNLQCGPKPFTSLHLQQQTRGL